VKLFRRPPSAADDVQVLADRLRAAADGACELADKMQDAAAGFRSSAETLRTIAGQIDDALRKVSDGVR
jgi:hypothetical protein